MTDIQAAHALATRSLDGATLTTEQVQGLLRAVEAELGHRPQMIVGTPLQVRWLEESSPRSYGRVLELRLDPAADGDDLAWGGSARLDADTSRLDDESRALRFQSDPLLGEGAPYVWNLRVCEPKQWNNDLLTEVPTWGYFTESIGRALSALPAHLAALPAEWYDGPLTMRVPHYDFAKLRATRAGLDVRLFKSDSQTGDTVVCGYAFTPSGALAADAGSLALRTLLSTLQGFTPHSLGVEGGLRGEPFSGFFADQPDPRQMDEFERAEYLENAEQVAAEASWFEKDCRAELAAGAFAAYEEVESASTPDDDTLFARLRAQGDAAPA